MSTKKLELIFGDVALTLTPSDIDIIMREWELANPGKSAEREMTSKEFADRCMNRMTANARPSRTVLHN